MMEFVPHSIPATLARDYPLIRIAVAQVIQTGAGQPLVVHYQIDRGRETAGVFEDAPDHGGRINGTMQVGFQSLSQNAALFQAIETISSFIAQDAIAKGSLQLQS